jgi:hypothetical protein
MTIGINKGTEIMAGVVSVAPTVDGYATLSTTPVKVDLCTAGLGQMRRVKISNLTASTNRLAWTFVAAGAAAPSLSADPAAATAGAILGPGQVEYLVISGNVDLYVVGSAASTVWCAVSFAV